MPVSSSTEHWIKPDALTINLNHFGDPDYLQVSVLAGVVVMAFKQDVIGYNAAHNYRTWPIEAANTYLETSSAYNVYARLTRSEVNARALIVYDTVLRDIEGREISYAENGSEVLGDASADYFFVYLGQLSGSVDSNGQSVQREWLIDFRFGSLDTSQYRNEESGGEWQKMFRLNKVTDMIDVLKTFSSAIFKKLFIGEKVILDIKRSTDSDEDVPVSDENLATSKYVESQLDNLDDRFLSKVKDDSTPHNLGVGKNLSVGGDIVSKDFAEGTEKGGYAIRKNSEEQYEVESDNIIARILAKTYDLLVQNHATFVGDLSSEEFISGFIGGKGWSIRTKEILNAAGINEKKSVAEFDDLIVRGSMRIYEFIVSQLLGENDNRIFTGMMEVDHYDAADGKVYLKTDNGRLYNPFRVDDVIIVQQYGGNHSQESGYYVTKQYEFIVTEVGVGEQGEDRLDWVRFRNFTTSMEGGNESLITEHDTLVRIDNISDANRKGIIQLMSVGEETPYMDFIYGAKTDPENSLKGRLGNLGGVYNPLFGWLKEFGAYLTNLYAVGEFVIAHTGENVSDSIEIAKGQFRTNYRQTTFDMSEEQNFFTNASMTNNCEHWVLGSDATEYFMVDELPQFFNFDLYASEQTYAGLSEWKGRDMLRLSKSSIMQSNSLIDKSGTHKVYTGSTENDDGSYTDTYEEVADTLYLSVRFFVSVSGKLEFGFVENGNFIDNSFHYSSNVTAREDGYEVKLSGIWDGKGDFTITSTGDVYVDLLSLTDKPLDNFKITTETKIEQDATRISLLGKKINGVEGSVTDLGIVLDAAKEEIRLYVDKVDTMGATVSQLKIDVDGIDTLVGDLRDSTATKEELDKFKADAADEFESLTEDIKTSLDWKKTFDDNNITATTIMQSNDTINSVAGAFVKQPDGSYKLTTSAGSLVAASVNEAVASLYAKKDDVSAELAVRVKYDPNTQKITSSIKLSADQIDMSANDYISIINKGTTTISASRVDLSGLVTVTSLNSTLTGYATDGELSAAQATLNKSISDLNTTLSTKINAKASTESLNTKVSELNTAIGKKADTSSLGSVAYMNDIAKAACNGSTLIVGGYINADLLKVEKIYANEGTVGGLTIESDKIVGKGTNGEMILSADIDGGYPGLTWKSDEQTLIGLQTHLLNGYKSSVLRLADNASEQSMLTPGYMDIDGKGGEIIINTTLSNEVTISINKSYKVNNVPMSYKMALGMDSNGLVRIGGQKWARSASEVQVGELWVDEDNYVKVRTS